MLKPYQIHYEMNGKRVIYSKTYDETDKETWVIEDISKIHNVSPESAEAYCEFLKETMKILAELNN